MTARDFCHWLDGYINGKEATGARMAGMTEDAFSLMRDKLKSVMEQEGKPAWQVFDESAGPITGEGWKAIERILRR